MTAFFYKHTRFLEIGETDPDPNRLIRWYQAIIGFRRDIYDGAKLLHLGGHYGRWSMAAPGVGATRVVGIEVQAHLIEKVPQFSASMVPRPRDTSSPKAMPTVTAGFDRAL